MNCKRPPGPPRRLLPGEGTFADQVAAVGLPYLSEHLQDFVSRATKERFTPLQTVEELVRLEAMELSSRSMDSRVARAQLGRFKQMADFDWEWPKSIDRPLVESIFDLSFLREVKNIVVVGTPGLGKTKISKNIAYAALQQGSSALYAPASKIIADLGGQETAFLRERRFRHYCCSRRPIIDPFGHR